jgi:hypothetical protein
MNRRFLLKIIVRKCILYYQSSRPIADERPGSRKISSVFKPVVIEFSVIGTMKLDCLMDHHVMDFADRGRRLHFQSDDIISGSPGGAQTARGAQLA